MSEQQNDQSKGSLLTHPQVLAGIITSVVAVVTAIIGILPKLLDDPPRQVAPPTAIIFVVTSTSLPPTFTLTRTPEPTETEIQILPTVEAPTLEPPTAVVTPPTITTIPFTATPLPPTSTPVPPTLVVPTAAPTAVPNVRLLFDDVSFTLLNLSGSTMTLENITFLSDGGRWDAISWGNNIHNQLPNRYCLRVRNAAVGPRNPPAVCGGLFGLMEVGSSALFWVDIDHFDVELDNNVIATCQVEAESCDIHIPQP